MALLTDPVNARHDIDTVYLDGVLVMVAWDTSNVVSDYVSGLIKRLHVALGSPGVPWTWAVDNREMITARHIRYTVGDAQVDYIWVKTPRVL